MEIDLTPEDIRGAEFRTSLRGVDRVEVAEFLDRVAGSFEQLVAETDRMRSQVEEGSGREVDLELEAVGREVGEILKTARDAAEAMRERASLDAARWRGEAMEEADTNRKEAAAVAEALRRDAWVTGTQLLEQAMAEAHSLREQAERDVLTVMGEAEREAHRLTSSARREAEDLVRNATMEAERVAAETAKRREEIIDQANRQAASAQERARALEQRRDELLEELENVRSTLNRLEGSLEEKRESMDLSPEESTSVRVVTPAPAPDPDEWGLGETVRVVPTDAEEPEPDDALRIAEEVSADVARLRGSLGTEGDRTTGRRRTAHPEPADEPVAEPAAEPDHVERPAAETEAADGSLAEPPPAEELPPVGEREKKQEDDAASPGDDVEALFRSLRSGGTVEEGSPEEAQASDVADEGSGWEDDRHTRLLPITNRALRGVKKAMTDLQNLALDGLRTDVQWRPDPVEIADALRAELITVWSESFAAGHAAAEERFDTKLKRPPTPHPEVAEDLADALAHAVSGALDQAGEEPRERQSAVSRVYRVWRTDEAERRVRDLATEAFRLGMEDSQPANASSGG